MKVQIYCLEHNKSDEFYEQMEEDEFDDFDIKRMTFMRFVKKVREESGYVKKERRIYKVGSEPLQPNLL